MNNLENIFFRKTALADPIFTLDGGSIVLAAFDLILAVIPLKVALGLGRIDFWAFQNNNHASVWQVSFFDYFLKCLKTKFLKS